MTVVLKTWSRPILRVSCSAISSAALPDGLKPLPLQNGRSSDAAGPVPVPVSRFRALDKDKEKKTEGIFGPLFADLSPSASLQRFLENRLQVRLAESGSLLYDLTWKAWDMLAGLPICRLQALAHRTSAKDYIGWPTPLAYTPGSGNNRHTTIMMHLLKGWSTPCARDYKDTSGMSLTGTNPDGSTRIRMDTLPRQAFLTTGVILNGCYAPTENIGQLNPDFVRWLMGFPIAWDNYAPMETP